MIAVTHKNTHNWKFSSQCIITKAPIKAPIPSHLSGIKSKIPMIEASMFSPFLFRIR